MILISKKPCTFGGKSFLIGEEIPCELVTNPKMQEKFGVIAIADGTGNSFNVEDVVAQVAEVFFDVPIYGESELTLSVTNEELKVFTDILQLDVKTTADKQKVSEMIQNIESEDLLIMLDALDGRKHVKEETQARAAVLAEGEESGGDD